MEVETPEYEQKEDRLRERRARDYERASEAFSPPASHQEAERRRLELVDKQRDIERALGDQDRRVDGRRVESDEYWQWRKRAVSALDHTTAELRRLKAWIKENRTAALAARYPAGAEDQELARDPSSGLSLLRAAWILLRRLGDEVDWDLDPAEQGVINDIRDFLECRTGDF